MATHRRTWQKYESRVCQRLGGDRRGADYSDGKVGKNDCVNTPGYSIEVKVWSRPSYQMMLDEARRAEDHREKPSDVPLAIVKRKGDLDNDSLVIMRLETFEKTLKIKLRERQLLKELGYD